MFKTIYAKRNLQKKSSRKSHGIVCTHVHYDVQFAARDFHNKMNWSHINWSVNNHRVYECCVCGESFCLEKANSAQHMATWHQLFSRLKYDIQDITLLCRSKVDECHKFHEKKTLFKWIHTSKRISYIHSFLNIQRFIQCDIWST